MTCKEYLSRIILYLGSSKTSKEDVRKKVVEYLNELGDSEHDKVCHKGEK